jgi:hypothetical protein
MTNTIEPSRRWGVIVDRHPHGSGLHGRMGTYFVRDTDTGEHYAFTYADIVTEGFRTIRTGERVRFFTDPHQPTRASYVIRLDEPDVEDFYR